MPPKIATKHLYLKRRIASAQKKLDPSTFEQMMVAIDATLKKYQENEHKWIADQDVAIDRWWNPKMQSGGKSNLLIGELVAAGGCFTDLPTLGESVFRFPASSYQKTPSKLENKQIARQVAIKGAILMSQKRSERQAKRCRDMATSTPSLPVPKKIDNTASVDKSARFRISIVNPKTPQGGRILPKAPRVANADEAIVTLKCSVSGTPLVTRDIIDKEIVESEEF